MKKESKRRIATWFVTLVGAVAVIIVAVLLAKTYEDSHSTTKEASVVAYSNMIWHFNHTCPSITHLSSMIMFDGMMSRIEYKDAMTSCNNQKIGDLRKHLESLHE